MPNKDDSDFEGKEQKQSKRGKEDKRDESYSKASKEDYVGRYYNPRRFSPESLDYRVSVLERQMKWLLSSSGLSLVVLLAGVFWLGGMKSTVSSSSDKVDKMYQIALENKDSLASRTIVIEAKLDAIDKKLTDLYPSPKTNTTGR